MLSYGVKTLILKLDTLRPHCTTKCLRESVNTEKKSL